MAGLAEVAAVQKAVQKIVPCIWFDRTAEEVAAFYAAAFPSVRVVDVQRYPAEGLPDFQTHLAGEPVTIEFEIAGFRMIALNAGPEFPLNPAVSFTVTFDPATDPAARERLDALWVALSDGGTALMPLQSYDFSPHFGWMQDRYGVSWQLRLAAEGDTPRPFITPSLMFGDAAFGRAGEAIETYTSLLSGHVDSIARLPDAAGPAAGTVGYAEFRLEGQHFIGMDSAGHDFTFTPGVSLMVRCADQAEIDRLWQALSAVPEFERCGWLVDGFGLSWQIVPDRFDDLMAAPGAYGKLMAMTKIEISAFGEP